MPYSLHIMSAPTGGYQVLDATPFVTSLVISSGDHGPQELRATIPRSLYDAFRVYDAPGTLHVEVRDGGQKIWAGRLEEPGLRVGRGGGALELNALGYWRALSDVPYTALWSDTSLARWVPLQVTQINNRTPERYEFSTDNNTLQIAPRKGELFGLGAAPLPAIGSYMYIPPSGTATQIQLVQFDLELSAPAGWTAIIYRTNTALSTFNTIFTIASAGALLTRSVFTSITADDRILFELFFNAAAAVAAFDTGVAYARLTNIRFCATAADIANTVFTANRAAGASVTATVVSTTNMYTGMRLTVNGAANPSESVVVESVTNSTQFVATFVNNYVIGNPVGGSRVNASTIVTSLVTAVSGTNATQLQNSAANVTSPNRDVVDAVYEDALPSEIVTDLAAQGDSSNRLYETGVDVERRVYFRQQGSRAATWYVDVDDLRLDRSLDGLANSAYTTYESASGIPTRTATASNAASVNRYGITRRTAVPLQTTNSAYATAVRDATVAAGALVQPRATVTVRDVYTPSGARGQLADVQGGDILVLRNLPPTASSAIDSIRTFRITRAEYDFFSRTLAIEPEAPSASLDALVGGQV